MKAPSRVAITICSHVLAVAGGWAIYQASGSPRVEKATAKVAAVQTKSADRSAADGKSSQEILASALKSNETKPFIRKPYDGGANSAIPQVDQVLRDRIDSIGIPADFAATLEQLMAEMVAKGTRTRENHADTFALAYQWLAKDPQAFFKWLNGDGKRTNTTVTVMFEITPELYRRSGTEGVLPLIAMAGRLAGQMCADLARSVAKAGDAAGILKARDELSGTNWDYFSRNVGSEWPNDRLADLIKLAVKCNDPQMALGHKFQSNDQGTYIAGLLADPSLPEDFRQKIAENPSARDGLARDPAIPLATRLENGANLYQVIKTDVGRLLTEQRDWAFAFRNGEATAQDIMDLVSAGTPDLARAEPQALRNQVFNELAEENPKEAMALLTDLTDEQRDEKALYTARTYFQDVEPSKFLELLEQVPADTPEQWEGRLDAWNLRSFTNNGRLQDGYAGWVQDLPPGLDRDMGLYSLARAVNESDPKLAASLRSQVTDPRLKQRISQHR